MRRAVLLAALVAAVAATVGLTVLGPGPGGTASPSLVPSATGAGSDAGGYAYVQSTDGGRTYHLVSAGGNGCCRHVITTHQVLGRAAFSPDRRRLAFSGPITDGSDGRYGIFVVNIDGSGLHRITTPRFADVDPAWSPDGRTIAFARDTKGLGNGYVLGLVNPDGSAPRSIPGTSGGITPAWSPDSRSLVFAAPDGLRTIGVGGGTSRLILHSGAVADPAWSPDGRRIAFVHHDREGSDTVAVLSATGGPLTPLEHVAGGAETPGWSADSTTVHWLDFLGEGEDGRTLTAVWKVALGHSPTFVFSAAPSQLHLAVYAGTPGPPPAVPRAIVGIRGAGDALYVRRQDAPSFRSLAGTITGPPSIVSAGGVAYYFAQGSDGNVWGRTDRAGWSRVGPAGATCSSPAAAVLGSTLTLACRTASGMLATGTATLSGAVPTVGSFTVVGGPITAGPAAGVVTGHVTLAATVAPRSDHSNVVLYAGGHWGALRMACAGRPGIGGWPPRSAWLACTSPAGALEFLHLHAPGQWAGLTTLGSGWTGAVGVASRPDGYASLYLQGTDGMIRLFDTKSFRTSSYGGPATGGAGAGEIVTP